MGRILCVDENRGCYQLISKALRLRGYRITLAGSAQEAFEVLKSEPTLLVLLDLSLPDLDGLEVLRRMSNHHGWRRIPVIVFTREVSARQRREAEALGAWAVFVKSRVSLGQLLNAIDRCVLGDAAGTPAAYPRLAAG